MYVIHDQALVWINSYLSDGLQRVNIKYAGEIIQHGCTVVTFAGESIQGGCAVVVVFNPTSHDFREEPQLTQSLCR